MGGLVAVVVAETAPTYDLVPDFDDVSPQLFVRPQCVGEVIDGEIEDGALALALGAPPQLQGLLDLLHEWADGLPSRSSRPYKTWCAP